MNALIHILPIDSSAVPQFQFSVDKMQSPRATPPYVRMFDSLDRLIVAMRSIDVDEEHIGKMQNNLATGKPFSLPDVYLTNQDLAKLGLYVLGKQRFSAISSVEGLKLDPAGAERLERTNGLRPEARRAETIQAFEQLRKRG